MKANYHSHTTRCGHASGTEREYVEKAIECGFKIWGFSDHTPYPFNDGYKSGIRMDVDELDDYVTTVLDLKKEYEKDIEIHLGLEVEYYPAYFQNLLDLVKDYPVEYFLLAQHFIGNEPADIYSGRATEDLARVKSYVDQVIEALNTGKFLYVAHPDLIRYTGTDIPAYENEIRRLCLHAKALDIPVEVNFLGLYESRHYPRKEFWKVAGEVGCKGIFGLDAHSVDAITWPKKILEPARELVLGNGMELVETMEIGALTGSKHLL